MIIGGDEVVVIFIYSVSFLKFVLRKLLNGVLQAGILESVAMIMFFAVKDEKFYIVSKNKPGSDCGSDPELLIEKFRLKSKKVGKSTKPFRYCYCYCSVTRLLLTLYDPMDCSTPGSPVLHYLLDFAHIHVL